MRLYPTLAIGLLLTMILTRALVHAGPTLTQSSFEEATAQLKTKCIDGICLGSTAEELSKHGSLEWHRGATPSGLLTCNFFEAQTATGRFTTPDGAQYNLSFDTVKEQGGTLSRYRLMAIGIEMLAKWERGAFYVSRWAWEMKFPPSTDKTVRAMKTSDENFFLVLESGPVSARGLDSARLSASYNFKGDWLQTFPKCRASGT